MQGTEALISTLIGVAVVFLVLRKVALWYWRVDETVALLREISGSLARIEAASAQRVTSVPPAASEPHSPAPHSPAPLHATRTIDEAMRRELYRDLAE